MVTSELDYYVTGNQKVDVISNAQKAGTVCSTTLGTSNVTSEKGIKIYPVPASQYIYVDMENRRNTEIKYQMLDMSGRIILQRAERPVSDRIEINVSSVPQGNYILKLTMDTEEISKKVMVSHH